MAAYLARCAGRWGDALSVHQQRRYPQFQAVHQARDLARGPMHSLRTRALATSTRLITRKASTDTEGPAAAAGRTATLVVKDVGVAEAELMARVDANTRRILQAMQHLEAMLAMGGGVIKFRLPSARAQRYVE